MDIRTCRATEKAETAALLSSKNQSMCNFCGKPGHFEQKCWKKFPHLNPRRKNNALVAQDDVSEEERIVCLIAKHEEYTAKIKTNPSNDWIIDSGCSNHMTHNKSIFTSLTPYVKDHFVELGNTSKARIAAEGTVEVNILVNRIPRICKLSSVLLVPELRYNLMSIPTIDKQGNHAAFVTENARLRAKHLCWPREHF